MTYSIYHSCLYLRNEWSKCWVSVMQQIWNHFKNDILKYQQCPQTAKSTTYGPAEHKLMWCSRWIWHVNLGAITMTIILVLYISVNSPQLISRNGTRRLDSMTGSQGSSPSNGCRAICPNIIHYLHWTEYDYLVALVNLCKRVPPIAEKQDESS